MRSSSAGQTETEWYQDLTLMLPVVVLVAYHAFKWVGELSFYIFLIAVYSLEYCCRLDVLPYRVEAWKMGKRSRRSFFLTLSTDDRKLQKGKKVDQATNKKIYRIGGASGHTHTRWQEKENLRSNNSHKRKETRAHTHTWHIHVHIAGPLLLFPFVSLCSNRLPRWWREIKRSIYLSIYLYIWVFFELFFQVFIVCPFSLLVAFFALI